MLRVFDRISAEFSTSFQEKYNSFIDSNNSLFQGICDATGVILVSDEFSKKLLGPWDSIKNAHELLSGYILFQSFSQSYKVGTVGNKQGATHPLPMQEMQELSLGQSNSLNKEKTMDSTVGHVIEECNDVLYTYDGRFHCGECDYSGLRKQNLRDHVHRMHNRPFRCRTCLQGFGFWKDLRRHQKNKTDCSALGYHHRGRRRRCLGRRDHCTSYLSGRMKSSRAPENNTCSTNCYELTTEVTESFDANSVQEENRLQETKEEENVSDSKTDKMDESSLQLHEAKNVSFTDEQIGNINHLQVVVKQEVTSDDELHDAVNYMQIQHQNNQVSSLPAEKIKSSEENALRQKLNSTPLSSASNSQIQQNSVLSPGGNSFSPVVHCSNSQAVHASKDETSESYSKSVDESTGELKFMCKHCCFTVHRKQLIEDHVKRIHIRQFRCDICGATFGLLKDLNRHYRKTHKIMIETQRRGRRAQQYPPHLPVIDQDYFGS